MVKKSKIKIKEIKKNIIIKEIVSKPLPKMQATSAPSRQILLDSINNKTSDPVPSKKIESQLEEVAKEAITLPSVEKPDEKRDVKYFDNSKTNANKHYAEPRKYMELNSYNVGDNKNPEEETNDLHLKHREDPFASNLERDQNNNQYNSQQDHFKKRKTNF